MNRETINGARFKCECGQRLTFMCYSYAETHCEKHMRTCRCRKEVKALSFPKPSEDMIYPDGSIEDGDAS